LRKEVADHPHDIRIFSSLNDLLEQIRVSIEIDNSLLVEEFKTETRDSISSILERTGLVMAGAPEVTVSSFVTEKPDKLYIDFTIRFECIGITDKERDSPKLLLKGEALYEPDTKTFSEFRNKGEEVTYVDSDGEQKSVNHFLMAGNVVIGHRSVEHFVRHPVS